MIQIKKNCARPVSDEYVEQLLLLQIVSFAEENVLSKLSVHVGVNLTGLGAVESREIQHSLVLVHIRLVLHNRFKVQQLRPNNISHLVRNSLVDSLRQFLFR